MIKNILPDLEKFSTATLMKTNPDHEMEIREQVGGEGGGGGVISQPSKGGGGVISQPSKVITNKLKLTKVVEILLKVQFILHAWSPPLFYAQVLQAPDENWDPTFRKQVWKCESERYD